jgi:hypothetical protein
MTSEAIRLFLEQLKVVATSPYALIGYIALVLVFALTITKAIRIKAVTRSLTSIPESDRKSVLENEYGVRLKEGMSATHFLRAQRNTYLFYAFLAVVITCLIISITALLRAQPTMMDSKSEAVRAAISRIIGSIEGDFETIKGTRSPDNDDEDAIAFESKVLIPDTDYNFVEIPKEADAMPDFIATLYHGSDANIAYRTYNNFVSQVRQCTPDWLEHPGILDKEKLVTDYVSFVKGKKKVVVSLNRQSDKPDIIHVRTVFLKPNLEDADNGPPGSPSVAVLEEDRTPSVEELDAAKEEQQKAIEALRTKGPPYGYRLTENCTVAWTNYMGLRIWVKDPAGIIGGSACPVEPLGVQIQEDPTHYYDGGEIKKISVGEAIPDGCYPHVDGICAAEPGRARIGQPVKFRVWPYGGSGLYVYNWSGEKGPLSTMPEYVTSFANQGIKTVKIAITSNGETVYKECKVIVTRD